MGGVPRTPQDPRNMGTFGLSIRGGAGRPPGEDGGGERGATMPTTSGVESERPWSDLSTRESKAVIEGILSRVPTPPRTPYHTIPYHTIPYHNIPFITIPYHTIQYHTIPYHTIPYHTIPYHTIPYHRPSPITHHPSPH